MRCLKKRKEGRKKGREGGRNGWIPVLKMITGLNDIPMYVFIIGNPKTHSPGVLFV